MNKKLLVLSQVAALLVLAGCGSKKHKFNNTKLYF